MSHTRANLLMLLASFIWGTAFVSQTTGMGAIGPFTFSFARFFFAFLTVLPLAIYFESNNIKKIFYNNKLLFLCFATGFALFVGMGLQQYALQKSQISNAAFLSTLYVPFVGIISRIIFKKQHNNSIVNLGRRSRTRATFRHGKYTWHNRPFDGIAGGQWATSRDQCSLCRS